MDWGFWDSTYRAASRIAWYNCNRIYSCATKRGSVWEYDCVIAAFVPVADSEADILPKRCLDIPISSQHSFLSCTARLYLVCISCVRVRSIFLATEVLVTGALVFSGLSSSHITPLSLASISHISISSCASPSLILGTLLRLTEATLPISFSRSL